MKMFVYGTLKQGFPNHQLMQGAKLISPSAWLIGAKLFSLGSFPSVSFSKNDAEVVLGELYEIDEKILSRLDRLEGTNPKNPEGKGNLFRRTVVQVFVQDREEDAFVYSYTGDLTNCSIISSGVWDLNPLPRRREE